MAILEIETQPVKREPSMGRFLHAPTVGSLRASRSRTIGVTHQQPKRELYLSPHHKPFIPTDPDYLQSCMDSTPLETAKPFNQE